MSVITKIQSFGGNVGIGVADPGSYKLKVVGGASDFQGISADSLTVGTTTNAHIPQGAIMMWAGTVAPPGWGLCNGTTYGSIVSPDLRDKFIIGAISSTQGTYAAGTTGGSSNRTLAATNLPSHTHNSQATAQGGSHAHQMTAAELPAHSHNVNAGGAHNTHNINSWTDLHSHILEGTGSHNHSNQSAGDHSHQLSIVDTRYAFGNFTYAQTAGSWTAMNNVTSYQVVNQPYVEDAGAHNHFYNAVGNHTHGGSLGNHPSSVHAHSTSSGAHTHTVGEGTHLHTFNQGVGNFDHTITIQNAGSSQDLSLLPPYYVLAYVIKI